MKRIIPVDMQIRRYYRTYIMVDENATDEQIRNAVKEMIHEQQDDALIPDPDMEIEGEDIEYIRINYDCQIYEEEDEAILIISKGE